MIMENKAMIACRFPSLDEVRDMFYVADVLIHPANCRVEDDVMGFLRKTVDLDALLREEFQRLDQRDLD